MDAWGLELEYLWEGTREGCNFVMNTEFCEHRTDSCEYLSQCFSVLSITKAELALIISTEHKKLAVAGDYSKMGTGLRRGNRAHGMTEETTQPMRSKQLIFLFLAGCNIPVSGAAEEHCSFFSGFVEFSCCLFLLFDVRANGGFCCSRLM